MVLTNIFWTRKDSVLRHGLILCISGFLALGDDQRKGTSRGTAFRNLKLLTTDPLQPQITSSLAGVFNHRKKRRKKTKVASVPTRQNSAKAQQKKGDLKCIHHRRKERPGSPENYFVAPCAAFSTTAKESLWVKLGANLPLSKQETNHELNTLNLQQ